MPRITQTITQTIQVEQTVKLTPKQQVALRKELQAIQLRRKKIKQLESENKSSVGVVEDVLADLGVEELEFEGFRSKIIAGTRKAFDKELFVRKGGSLKIYNEAFVEAPVAAYVKVTAPSEKDE